MKQSKPSDLLIMVADSNEKSRELMCDALERFGIEHIVCAESAGKVIEISNALCEKQKLLSMLFCNDNILDMSPSDFISWLAPQHPGLISISYSECTAPEAHLMSLMTPGVVDHIEQTEEFESSITVVFNRWLGAAKLTLDYRNRYGTESRQCA